MTLYKSYGGLDDVIREEVDYGFVGFNNRLRPDQLKPGVLADIQNARLSENTEWQTRKGINNIKAPLATGETAAQLPFFLINDATGYTSNSLAITSQKLHITVNQNLTSTLSLNMTGVLYIDTTNLTGISLDSSNHSVTITAISASSATFRVDNVTYSSGTPGGSVDLDSTTLNDSVLNEVFGSCIFSDPNAESESYIILAANSKLVAIKISDPTTSYDLAYPTGETVGSSVELIQAFNKIYVFRKGDTPFVKDLSTTNINTSPQLDKADSGEYSQPSQIVCAAGEFALIENRGIVHQADGVSQGDIISVVGDKTLSADQSSGLVIGERFTVAKVFTSASTQNITSATSTSVTGGEFDGLHKVTCSLNGHGYNVGDPITIDGFNPTNNVANGKKFVAEKTLNEFIFYVDGNPSLSADTTGTVALAHGFEFYLDPSKTSTHVTDGESLTSTPVFARRISEGLGFSHMPAPEYGVYHQKRLAVPYRYSVDDLVDNYTDRKIFDEILLSDILDTDTYDQVYGQFRFNAGKADFNVGMHSFSDDKLIVFNRNSIHIVVGSGDPSSSLVQLLTDEVGLVARHSVIQVGNQVLFLSDNGIYGMNFIDLYNLRGNEVPLSESIDATIKTITKDHASKASAVYFDNRYYIAVPTGGSTFNNTLLIYNFLNKSWESIDSVGLTDTDGNSIQAFEFTTLLVAGEGTDKGVYIVNTQGGIHKLEVYEDGIDRVITEIGVTSPSSVTVSAVAKTRRYTFNSISRKKWKEFEVHLQSSPNHSSNLSLSGETENPDSTLIDLKPVNQYLKNADGTTPDSIPADEDVSIRGRLGNNQGYGFQMTLTSTLGRPRFKKIKVSGSTSDRSTTSVQ